MPFPVRIKTRLTVSATLITLTVSSAVCGALYVGLSFSLHREVDSFLEGEVQEFLAILHQERGESLAVIEQGIRRELGSRLRRDLTFRLLDATGRSVLTSDPGEILPDPWSPLPPAQSRLGVPQFNTIESTKGNPAIRVCSQWTELTDQDAYLAQATYTLAGVTSALTRFGRICATAMILAVGLAIIGGRLLARRILQPIHHMTLAARRVRAENLSCRLNRTGNRDELDGLAEVLNEMLQRLEDQFVRIQQFTADAAHELRTPLAALRGNAEVALSGTASEEELRAVLAANVEEYDRLSRITDDLLLLARADSGRPFLQREPFLLNAAIQDVIELYAPLAQEKNVALAFQNGAALQVEADRMRIRQVLSNLLDNAIKYTSAGGKVALTLAQHAGRIELNVADSGPGIPAEHLAHIFDRFYRVDAARSRERGGSGLGLAICRAIIEAHGGTIAATSTRDGTTITVRL